MRSFWGRFGDQNRLKNDVWNRQRKTSGFMSFLCKLIPCALLEIIVLYKDFQHILHRPILPRGRSDNKNSSKTTPKSTQKAPQNVPKTTLEVPSKRYSKKITKKTAFLPSKGLLNALKVQQKAPKHISKAHLERHLPSTRPKACPEGTPDHFWPQNGPKMTPN